MREKKRPPICILLKTISDLKEANELYDNQFNYISSKSLPVYITVSGFYNKDYSWFGWNTANKKDILKRYNLLSIKEAKKIHIPTPKHILEINKKENSDIDDLFENLI